MQENVGNFSKTWKLTRRDSLRKDGVESHKASLTLTDRRWCPSGMGERSHQLFEHSFPGQSLASSPFLACSWHRQWYGKNYLITMSPGIKVGPGRTSIYGLEKNQTFQNYTGVAKRMKSFLFPFSKTPERLQLSIKRSRRYLDRNRNHDSQGKGGHD